MRDEESESLALVFLEQFWADHESGKTKCLEEYLRLFPGAEETIASEYLNALTEARGGDDSVSGRDSRDGRIGHYQLIEELGRGGQGVVWLAEDTRLGRKVALKVLTGLGPGAEGHLARFKREAALASKLDHPGICAVHDTGIESGIPYIAMRLVDGESLADRLGRFRSAAVASDLSTFMTFDLDEDEKESKSSLGSSNDSPSSSIDRAELDRIITVFEKVALALHVAHEAGIVHRDIKPGNIMLTKEDDPVILDFGLAHDDSDDAGPSLTQTGDLFGTPAYMSPEQITGRRVKVDRRSDIYSLAVTLYECLTTKRPFEEATRESLYQAILSKEALPARKINRRISSDLEVVLQCAMDKDRDKRYQTAANMAEDLRRIRENEPIVARPIGPVGRTLRWAKRRPATASLLATVFIALSAIATITTLHNRRLGRLNTDLEKTTKVAEVNAAEATRSAEEARENLLRANEEATAKDVALRAKTAALSREQAALAEKTSALSEYERMADTRRLANARAAADGMWPVHPNLVPKLEAWRLKYAPLFARLDGHRAALDALRKKLAPYTEAERKRDFSRELARIAQLEVGIPKFRELVAASDDVLWNREANAKIANYEIEFADLREKVKGRGSWDFGDDIDLQFRHDALARLVSDLSTFTSENSGVVSSVAERITLSRRIARETLENRSATWDETIARIASNPRYGGLTLSPQLGLIPLGPDPASGLEEFLDWRTHDWSENNGALPTRDEEGRIAMTGTRGLIFVLIPGGSFHMGAQKRDPAKPNYDPEALPVESPVHEVVLSAYFISKYEMTQGQWSRFDGVNPSHYHTGMSLRRFNAAAVDSRHPVEQVSWEDCKRRLEQLGLLLPTEAQWECAARARANPAVIWSGTSNPRELGRFANLRGREARNWRSAQAPVYEDGYVAHAPVGSFAANAFGLHDTTGNLCEWVRDPQSDYGTDPKPGDGLRRGDARSRGYRGGCFTFVAPGSRIAIRQNGSPSQRVENLGVRPSRSITTN